MRGHRRRRLLPRVVVVLLGGALSGVDVSSQMTGDWKRVEPGRPLAFPRDHASHPEYRIEWWYYTGNVASRDGRRFGYQLTFFRVGLDPQPVNPSRWAIRDLFMAHLAITDIERGRHRSAERLNRAGVGWAGASVEALNVWNEDWRVAFDGQTHVLTASDRQENIGLSLRLDALKPPVAHGDSGFSPKGGEPGNASYYYSLTRMATRGTLVVDGRPVDVEGLSWMDHEFSTSFLEEAQEGWDWFSVQLDDGSDLMVYRIRRDGGASDERSSGTLVDPSGGVTPLRRVDVLLEAGRRWRSTRSGAAYPVAWTLKVPQAGLDLAVEAAVDAQELVTAASTRVTYWEGAITVRGTVWGRAVSGGGYLEMTGYAGRPMSDVLKE